MPADVTEQQSPEQLLKGFRDRYNALAEETRSLQAKIRENENTALKLMGAIETLEYLHPPTAPEEEQTETEE
ncbi:hypothetical protein SSZBM1_201 [Synechococcus phage S-SZBM1]|uniref:Uncharacterized protein n=1 Tax=Synechococcus phage S-SZBM1 TaxID=2926475 RepID=A0AC61TSX1_9CAUD|nr:hypothetical protein PP650_gp075 [Synechococcus phage S-SZBM1]UNH61318.1 hypothetical protein SSZBM1_201 [Synechococcus phage S-SZBM1]